ncbi:MAG TPA: ADP-ribosylglycohydrolase family protein [Steroidobacteraceae bacterium]|nr:ADP-ribosylglycohydrolase family protein [Steroidobacteraceae bacterium]
MSLSTAPATLAPPLPNSYWVLPARLLAGEYPGAATPELTRPRLARLLEAGIDCFLDLTHSQEIAPYEAGLPEGVIYLRRSIQDHAIPAAPAQMAEILDCLESARREGRVTYLHCRAGIGRTGMVVGCLLAEQGFIGDEALNELNRLWRQSARSALWPSVPETPEQVEYVRSWKPRVARESDPLLEPGTLAAARGLRGRFHGALLGLATGDAVAAATQHRRPGRFTPVGDMLGGGPFDLPRGAWTDDTAMALCLAESLLEREGFDARDQVARYRRWQQEGYLSSTDQCVGITAGTARALALAQWRGQPFAGTHDPATLDPESLCRVTPVTLYFFSQGATVAAEQAAQAARITCQAPLVLGACRALAQALHAALSGRPRSAILAAGRSQLPAEAPPESAPGALTAALAAFEAHGTFREAVLAAANLGGNSDVIAAACGAIAGAHHSAGAIPATWRDSLLKRHSLEGFADRLLAHALLDLE